MISGDAPNGATGATDSTKVPLSTVTTKGDLITATGSGAVTRRAVGSANQFLAPNSGNSDGLEWRALTPSDMPTQNELEANASSQTLNSNNYTTIAYDTPGTNTGPAWSYSGGIWTCLIAGKYDIDAIIYVYSSVVVELYINKNGTRRYGGSAVICSSAPYVHRTISFAIGDTMYIESYAAGTGPTLDVSIAGLREIAINRRA